MLAHSGAVSRDTLSDVLRSVRLRSAVFFNVSGLCEWAAEVPPAKQLAPLLRLGVEHVIGYHAVAHGSCWAGMPGGPSVQLLAGDVVMFPHGDAHVVSSAPGVRDSGVSNWLAGGKFDPCPLPLSCGGRDVAPAEPRDGGTEPAIVCGFLGCDLQPFNPLITALPRLLHLRAGKDDTWITRFTKQAVAESHARRPGAEVMLARMSETMFVDAVRRYADQLPQQGSGWLAGLRDRFVGRVLALMHERPDQSWTIDELGRRAGLSRSALHDRFLQFVGMPPMQYLAQWRMQAAARALLETRSTIASIALDVGYGSESAFVRAFKRALGRPPAAWRREREAVTA
jgi:AraC-like DNA-binding protein